MINHFHDKTKSSDSLLFADLILTFATNLKHTARSTVFLMRPVACVGGGHCPMPPSLLTLSFSKKCGAFIIKKYKQLKWPSGMERGFDSESGQTNDFKIGIHSFPA